MKKLLALALSAFCIFSHTNMHAQNGYITTIAGNGAPGYFGDGGPATAAEIYLVYGICVDNSGNIYLSDWNNHAVRKIVKSTGFITTYGGNGGVGYTGDGGPATDAEIHSPYGIALDNAGNLYINDEVDNAIRKITASTGVITTIAGTGGVSGFMGDGGQATAAEINNPHEGLAFDASGNLYFGDFGNNCIRKINTSGIISTIAGIGGSFSNGYTGDGGPATAAELDGPAGLALDVSGNIYFADQLNNVVRKIDMGTGVITTVAGNYLAGAGYSGDGGLATAAELNDCGYVAFGSGGNLYITDDNNNVVRKVTTSTGVITTIAGNGTFGYNGDGGPATSAEMRHTNLVNLPATGGMLIGDDENFRIREIKDITSVSEIQTTDNGISLYPNPANDIIYLTSEKQIVKGTLITLFDISGKEIWNKNISTSEKTISLNMNGLLTGTYMLKIMSPNGDSETKKFVLVK